MCIRDRVIVLVLLDIVLYCMFRSYFYSTVEQTLRSELNVISTVLTRYYNSSSTGSGTNYSNEVRNTVESFTKKDRMELMMINSEGKVVITSSGFEPVSYTHLDVYKRQRFDSINAEYTLIPLLQPSPLISKL